MCRHLFEASRGLPARRRRELSPITALPAPSQSACRNAQAGKARQTGIWILLITIDYPWDYLVPKLNLGMRINILTT